MTNRSLNELFQIYRGACYISLKYAVTIPVTLVGNLLDLCFLGFSKKLINVSPLMTSFPFIWEASRLKEEAIADWSLLNKGFAGVFRAIAAILLEIPLVMTSAVLGTILTGIHKLISPVVSGLTDLVHHNFFNDSVQLR